MSEKDLLKQALYLLNQASICLKETEIVYAPLYTTEQIETLPKAYRIRFNNDFRKALCEFYDLCKKEGVE